ncbi:hypothetical protein GDO81_006586 [Engystomops pustulosus]|uniref:Uncharacterized protein n=1 Tax=Engystomops pustulosus TaxID=76066 RepID=A0AAV7CZQ2_ENGPU|nr:hypothetical protein GDO81_006586 [Engystomops pustulosus]
MYDGAPTPPASLISGVQALIKVAQFVIKARHLTISIGSTVHCIDFFLMESCSEDLTVLLVFIVTVVAFENKWRRIPMCAIVLIFATIKKFFPRIFI